MRLRVAMTATEGERCGIAVYARRLVEALREFVDVDFVPLRAGRQDSARPYLKLFLTCMYSGNAELVVARVTDGASFAELGGGVGERVRRCRHIGMAAGAGVGGR